jgi:septal ring factor EnvC (AmiA/AmiB activator)
MDEKEVIDMESMVQDHERRIIELEKNYGEVKKDLNAVQASQSKIENMLYSQNTEQKQLIEKHQKEQRMIFDTLLEHTLGIKKDSNNHKWGVIAAAVGGGGLAYMLFEFVKYVIGG